MPEKVNDKKMGYRLYRFKELRFNTWEEASKLLMKIGYPVLIKDNLQAVAVKECERLFHADEIKSAYETAKAETLAAFKQR
ncbi:hypothetical protein [Lachnobacterium bovis]|uniref:hypothetical protein n=1 Tax=Lachnobacterium bovis TaxID=140626 RepID=UPI00048C91D6|nr:hypothetical protein [Lachnobacterium bovis]